MKSTRLRRDGSGRGVDAQRIGLVDHLGGLKDASDAAAKLADLGTDYEVEYIETELSLKEQLLMQIRSEATDLGRMAGLGAPTGDLERLLDPFMKQARELAKLNDPHGLYAYCWCSQPQSPVKTLIH